MEIIKTKGGNFKGLTLTQAEYDEVNKLLWDSCMAVAERQLATNWNINRALSYKICSAVMWNYKYLKVEG